MPAKRVLLPYLNTGGGHRSAALAVAEALEAAHGAGVKALPVDVTAECFEWPLCALNAAYERLASRRGRAWGLTYHLTNGTRRIQVLEPLWWQFTGGPLSSLLAETQPDGIVCCHPLLKAPLAEAVRRREDPTPLITLVTDLACGHATWFYPADGPCLVPTEEARDEALRRGLARDSVVVTGLPVASKFVQAAHLGRAEARGQLGLHPKRPTVVVIAGADGMGPFQALLEPLLAAEPAPQVAAITGRNERLREKLNSRAWPQPLRVTGFVENLQVWMAAADLVVTKAGPGTIAEALVVGVPMVVCGAVPGQEPPNVNYVVERGAALWEPEPARAAQTAHRLLWEQQGTLKKMRARAEQAGRPDAARRAAILVWKTVRSTPAGSPR